MLQEGCELAELFCVVGTGTGTYWGVGSCSWRCCVLQGDLWREEAVLHIFLTKLLKGVQRKHDPAMELATTSAEPTESGKSLFCRIHFPWYMNFIMH